MALGKKRIELRSWNTKFRGEFLIHAPMRVRIDDVKRLKMNKKFITGAIIGKAEIYNVKKYTTQTELRKDYQLHFASKQFQGRYGFLIKNPKMFKIPITHKGRLGFFEVQTPYKKISDEMITSDIIDEEYRHRWIGRH